MIVAAAENGVIGRRNQIPWRMPAELAYFKKVTMGHPIIMGRKTHESIGRTLPGRRNIVITHHNDYTPAEGTEVVGSLDNAFKLVEGEDEVFIIGGASIYEQVMPVADRLYLTKVHASVDGEVYFKYDTSEWKEVSREPHQADDKNQYAYEFKVLER